VYMLELGMFRKQHGFEISLAHRYTNYILGNLWVSFSRII